MSEDTTKILPDGHLRELIDEVRAIASRLERFEERFDARAKETRPMSERIDQILAEVASTRNDVREMATRIDQLEASTKHELREVNRTLRRMNLDFATALRNQDDLEDRLVVVESSLRPAQ
jgi:chromosome segregation ATPase